MAAHNANGMELYRPGLWLGDGEIFFDRIWETMETYDLIFLTGISPASPHSQSNTADEK